MHVHKLLNIESVKPIQIYIILGGLGGEGGRWALWFSEPAAPFEPYILLYSVYTLPSWAFETITNLEFHIFQLNFNLMVEEGPVTSVDVESWLSGMYSIDMVIRILGNKSWTQQPAQVRYYSVDDANLSDSNSILFGRWRNFIRLKFDTIR